MVNAENSPKTPANKQAQDAQQTGCFLQQNPCADKQETILDKERREIQQKGRTRDRVGVQIQMDRFGAERGNDKKRKYEWPQTV
jgi:hypothetical protein